MSNEGQSSKKVFPLVQRSLEKTIAGRRLRFVEPGATAEEGLAESFAADEPQRYVSQLITLCVAEPKLTLADVETLPETARARARVAVAEVMGVARDYRRLTGDGDSRLKEAMRLRNERLVAELKVIGAAMSDNVVRFARDAQRAIDQLGGGQSIARLAADTFKVQSDLARVIAPLADTVAQANRAITQARPALDWFEQNQRLFAKLTGAQHRLGASLARGIEPLVRPAYFGALADIQRQVDLARPRYLDALTKTIVTVHESVAPRMLTLSGPKLEWPALRQINEAVEAVRRAIGPDIARFADGLGESLRRQVAGAAQIYASWLERHWPEVYANPEHPAPVLFLLASLPMSVGLPIYEAVEQAKCDDELLDGLERALQTSSLLAQIERAVQGSHELDQIAKRRLVVALEAVGNGQYVDAAPQLCQGLERAFTALARRRGIIDDANRFVVPARREKARKVEDVFEHLIDDYGYRRYLNAWVFGELGNDARHGNLEDEAAHRRWVLRALAALLGWFQYCVGHDELMQQLVARLELTLGAADAQAS